MTYQSPQGMRLFDDTGNRLYINANERAALLKAAASGPRELKCFAHVMVHTGARISEALALSFAHVDLSAHSIIIHSLKKRRTGIYRAVPVPTELIEMLDMVYGIRETQQRGKPTELQARVFPWGRSRTSEKLKMLMDEAGIADGAHKTAKGLRHGFGVNAVQKGVQLNMLQKWMGHADIKTTAIYANATGQEERDIASRMWE